MNKIMKKAVTILLVGCLAVTSAVPLAFQDVAAATESESQSDIIVEGTIPLYDENDVFLGYIHSDDAQDDDRAPMWSNCTSHSWRAVYTTVKTGTRRMKIKNEQCSKLGCAKLRYDSWTFVCWVD